MKNLKKIVGMMLMMLAMTQLTGCFGTIETGNVGLRYDFNGTVNQKLETEGFFTAVFGRVEQHSVKEIAVDLDNLTPKAKDNLSLQDLDVSVHYRVNPDKVRDLAVKRSNMSVKFAGVSSVYPAYNLIKSVAMSEVADAVSKIDSLVIHTQRDKLAMDVQKSIQASLDASDPGTFVISRVVVRQVKTDPTIEQSIRSVVAKEKELEAAKLNVAVAEANARATQQTAQTLTPAFLQHEYNTVLMKFAEKGGTVILDGTSSGKILNLPK